MKLVYPFDFVDSTLTKSLLVSNDLKTPTVNVNIKIEEKSHHGAPTSRDPGIGREAVQYMLGGMDFAAELGST